MASAGDIDQLLEFEKLGEDVEAEKNPKTQDDNAIRSKRQSTVGRVDLHIPRTLTKMGTSDKIDLEEIFLTENRERASTTSLYHGKSIQQKNTKTGLNFTTNSVGLLFRLNKMLEKRSRFKSHKQFDENLGLLQKLFGLINNASTIFALHNQSLSSLGNIGVIFRLLFHYDA